MRGHYSKRFRDETQAVNKLARFVSNLHLPAFARLQVTVDCPDHFTARHRSFFPCGLVIHEGQTVVIDARFFVPIQMKKIAGHREAPTMRADRGFPTPRQFERSGPMEAAATLTGFSRRSNRAGSGAIRRDQAQSPGRLHVILKVRNRPVGSVVAQLFLLFLSGTGLAVIIPASSDGFTVIKR